MITCPSDQVFTRLIEGLLPAGELQALEAHCDGCPACARVLAELARTIAPDAGEWLDERYRLLDTLGAGGMGVVYTAFDSKLRRRVAVKRLRDAAALAPASPASPAAKRRARFLREAQLLASLSHPNVLTVHDVGGGGDGEIYVVTELVDGWPMSRWCAEARPYPGWRQIVDLYLQAGRGLSAAHRVGVVHRDVKPENILVARSGRVLIGDFGLAGLTAPDGATAAGGEDRATAAGGLTETGTVLGTPAYMAPEQHGGGHGDPLSDQFSFCVSLYESLHRRRPFAGDTGAEIAAAARAGRPPAGGDGVPRAVDRVLAMGLDADPRRRHRSMDDLLARLARAGERRPVRSLLAAGTLVVVAAAAATAVALRYGGALAPRPQQASAPVVASAAAKGAVAPPPGSVASVASAGVGAGPSAVAATAVAAATPPSKPAPRRSALRRRHLVVSDADGGSAGTSADHALYLADRAFADRDGRGCLVALQQVHEQRWPRALAERALRRRAACEMLRGNCDRGRRLLEPLEGAKGARESLLVTCPPASFAALDDRIGAVIAQADQARYAGNPPGRRRELRQALLRDTAAPAIQTCLRSRRSSRSCGHLLAVLAQAYQALAESFLVGGDCQEGARLDVMQSQVKFHGREHDEGDPALACRSRRIFETYKTCAPAGEEAERRCLSRDSLLPASAVTP